MTWFEVALDVELDGRSRLGLEQGERDAAEHVVDGIALPLDHRAEAIDQPWRVRRLQLVLEGAPAIQQPEALQHRAAGVRRADRRRGAGGVRGQDQHVLGRGDRHDAGGDAGGVRAALAALIVAQIEQAVGAVDGDGSAWIRKLCPSASSRRRDAVACDLVRRRDLLDLDGVAGGDYDW